MIDLRQQFFPVQCIDNELPLVQLSSFMLSTQNLLPLDFTLPPPSTSIAYEPIVQVSSPYLLNKCDGDVLFWSVYISIYGLSKFKTISHNLQRYEIEYKKKIIQQIKEDGKSFKLLNHKLTNINIQEMMSELSVSKTSTLLSVYSYATAYKQNIYIVYPNHTYMSILHTTPISDYIIIYYINKYKCGFEQCDHIDILNQLMKTHVAIETPENPLKSISNYKLSELVEIADILQVSHEKTKKQELYNALREQCYYKML